MPRNVLESATSVLQRGKTPVTGASLLEAPVVSLSELRAELLLVVLSLVPMQDPFHYYAVGKDDISGEQWNSVSLEKLRT